MDDVPRDLPALLYAHKIQRKAASAGFDWEGAEGALPKIGEELGELSDGDCRRRSWCSRKRRWHLATRVRSGTS